MDPGQKEHEAYMQDEWGKTLGMGALWSEKSKLPATGGLGAAWRDTPEGTTGGLSAQQDGLSGYQHHLGDFEDYR